MDNKSKCTGENHQVLISIDTTSSQGFHLKPLIMRANMFSFFNIWKSDVSSDCLQNSYRILVKKKRMIRWVSTVSLICSTLLVNSRFILKLTCKIDDIIPIIWMRKVDLKRLHNRRYLFTYDWSSNHSLLCFYL